MTENEYIKIVLNNIPRLLTQLDRNKFSKTYGSFDRDYWHYKIRDFTSMILQQGMLSLALLYANNFKGNVYYKKEKIREWAISALNFWKDNQLSDGSFNEYYPNEHGYPPTVFSLYATSETYKTLKLSDKEVIDAMIKSCRFLSKKFENEVLNQEIASITSLYNIYLITNKKWILESVNEKLKKVLKLQSNEGWFPEYGGVDIGYLSVSLSYLAEYYKLSNNKNIVPVLKKIIDFIKFFVHPNNTIGGDYGSRDTEYFLPNGLEIVAQEYPLAGSIADTLIRNNEINNLLSVDDRYLTHYFLHDFIRAILNYKPREKKILLPCQKKSENFFQKAGLYEINNEKYYAILGLSKGGVLKVFKNKNLLISDCGYVTFDKNRTYVTNWIDEKYEISKQKNSFTVSGKFHIVKQYVPTQLKHSLLRLGSFTMGGHLIPILKKILITMEKTAPITFKRKVSFFDDRILIEDLIKSNKKLNKIFTSDKFSFRFVPSSKFFHKNDITNLDISKTIENFKEIIIKKEFDIKNEKVKINVD